MKTPRSALVWLSVLAATVVTAASPCFAQGAGRMEEVVQTDARDKTFMGTVLLARGGVAQLASERKEITLPVATLSKYVGTYELAPGVNMLMRLVDGRLTTQLTGQPQFPVFAESETKFFLKVVEAQVEFFTDASGTVTHAVMYQNGRERKVPRTSATVVEPPQRKEITVAAGTLARYAGTYQAPGDAELSVTLEGSQLKAQLTGQPAFPIFAESDTVFFYKVVEATLEFQKDASGAVTGVRLRQGQVDWVAPKK